MPRPTDGSEHPSSLPQPGLNPLLNPVLAQHMGRWAEVYFTTPPEKREEAVLDLIRELETESGTQAPTIERVEVYGEIREHNFLSQLAMHKTEPSIVPCPSCGASNTAEQRFCGMCGVTMQATESAENRKDPGVREMDFLKLDRQAIPSQVAPEPVESFSFAGSFPPEKKYANDSNRILVPMDAPANHQANRNDNYDREIFSLRHSLAGGGSSDYYEQSTSVFHDYRYRIYAGVVLTILLGILIYMGWRGTQALTTQGLPPSPNQLSQPSATNAPQASASHTQPEPNAGASGAAQNSDQTAEAQPNPTQSNPVPLNSVPPGTASANNARPILPAAPVQSGESAASARSIADSAKPPLQRAATLQRISESAPARGNGTEELAVAQGFLNSKPGQSRDAGEAAKWLWKSVGKQNATAALLLSDLYVRGDGVTQSCDQARLLLDAAARKAVPGAAERIRNLQTKGCR